ncbi:MAG: SDR family oxidoreductase [Prolixibacteraceae bacterium]|nr:SDR family oxidoreductase [Prolixibacteraceae bacterium]
MKKVVLITGISSGFGKETALLLAKAGHTVYGTVRKAVGSDPLVKELLMDLTDGKSIKAAIETVLRNEGRIDVLINNAGMHTGGPIETLPFETIQLQMHTNFLGLVQLTQSILPFMRKQGGGTIINFGSIGGLMGLPYQGIYSAGKFAIEGFSEALRMEVKQFNIKVVVINPGDFHTSNSANRRGFLSPTGEDDPYQAQFAKTLSIIEKDETKGWDPQILAKKLVRIVECKNPSHRYIIASLEQKLAVVLKYILPGKLFSKILRDHYGIK